MIFALLLIGSACDNMARSDTAKATSLISGNIYTLDVDNRHYGGDFPARQSMKFWTGKKMTQFRTDLVDKSAQPGTATYFQSAKPSILIHLGDEARGASDYCLRLLSADGRESSYILSGLEAIVKRSPVDSFSMLLPYHLADERFHTAGRNASAITLSLITTRSYPPSSDRNSLTLQSESST